MLNTEIQRVVDELVPLFRQFPQSEYGIAVGGAHAKGTVDKESDLDVYVFSSSIRPNAQRTQLAARFSPDIREVVSWGAESPFVHAGTDFMVDRLRVECWLRASTYIDRTISDCADGLVKREFVTWTTTGFYNHCALSDLKAMIPIDDPSGMLAKWKRSIQVYPPKLRWAILRQHLQAARFWPSNFHYRSAIEREDLIYTSGIIQQVVHNLVQVLFALNKVYFPGDKMLADALQRLHKVPDSFVERIQDLMFSGESITVQVLRAQQQKLQRLLKEVEDLVQDEIQI